MIIIVIGLRGLNRVKLVIGIEWDNCICKRW